MEEETIKENDITITDLVKEVNDHGFRNGAFFIIDLWSIVSGIEVMT